MGPPRRTCRRGNQIVGRLEDRLSLRTLVRPQIGPDLKQREQFPDPTKMRAKKRTLVPTCASRAYATRVKVL